MSMRSLESNDAEDFSELICPECGRNSIREYEPLSEEYNSKHKKLLNASRCQNESCPKSRLTSEEVRVQLKSSGFFGRTINYVKQNPLTIGGILIGIFVLFFGLQILFSGGTTVTVDGKITTQNGDPIEGATVYFSSKQTKTGENGKYSISLTPGNYTYYVEPPTPSKYGFSPSMNVTVTTNGRLKLRKNISETTQADATKLDTSLKNISTHTKTLRTSDDKIPLFLDNPQNIDRNSNPRIIFDGTQSNKGSISIKTGNKQTKTIQAETLIKQNLHIFAPETKTDIHHSISNGETQYNIEDSLSVSNPQIVLNGTQRQITETYTGSGSKTLSINSNTKTDLTATIIGQGNIQTQEKTGTYTGTNPTISLSEPQSVEVTVTGGTQESQQSIEKIVQETASFEITGDENAKDVTFNFPNTNSNPTKQTTTIDANGEDGTETVQKPLVTAETQRDYTISLEKDIRRNSNLVKTGYRIGKNGEKQEFSGEKTISLDAGQTLYVWITANHESTTQENTGKNKFDGDGSEIVDVIDYSVSSTNINPGETITVTATLKNTGDRRGAARTVLWKNGGQVLEKTVYVDKKQTKQVEIATVSFQETGSVGINGLDPTIIKVNTDGKNGAGTLTATAIETAQNQTGEVNIQLSNGQSCTAEINGGSCSFGSLQPKTYEITMDGKTEKQTPYTIDYTKTAQPRDVTVDIDNDGELDISHTGSFSQGESETATKKLSQGSKTINIQTENKIPVNYQISWQQTTESINKFSATKDGETIIENQKIQGKRTFQVTNLSSKDHTFSFESSKSQYKVRFSWVEYNNPDVDLTVNENPVCKTAFKSSKKCNISKSSLQTGNNIIQSDGPIEAQFKYTIESIPSKVTATINGKEYTFERIDAKTIYENRTWETSLDIDDLKTGENTFKATAIGGEAIVTTNYNAPNTGAKNPRAIIKTPTGKTKTVKVPQQDLQQNEIFTTTYNTQLRSNWLTEGKNTITIKTDTPIPVKATIIFSSTANQSR